MRDSIGRATVGDASIGRLNDAAWAKTKNAGAGASAPAASAHGLSCDPPGRAPEGPVRVPGKDVEPAGALEVAPLGHDVGVQPLPPAVLERDARAAGHGLEADL